MNGSPTDEQLLAALHDLFASVDPPPADLAEGVLARLGVEDLALEYELLSLVDSSSVAAVRSAADTADAGASVTLEFAGGSYRVLLRVDTVEGQRRLDGWVMPAVPMRISLVPDREGLVADHTESRSTSPDDNGRFEFAEVEPGRFRVWLHPDPQAEDASALHPFATLPFLI
ncbi:MAG TPA: hypothetical protein VFM09_14295 [Marmoricola sp.]|nr:hypothetical protein [Marmoricola sp.]